MVAPALTAPPQIIKRLNHGALPLNGLLCEAVVPLCSQPGCDRPRYCKGFCPLHYRRALMDIPLDLPARAHGSQPEVCLAPGCELKPLALGYCARDYQRLKRNVSLALPPARRYLPTETCDADGCVEKPVGRGLCHTHWKLRKLAENLANDVLCSIDGCHEPVRSRGLCPTHYWLSVRIRKFPAGVASEALEQSVLAGICCVEGCDKKPEARGMCRGHYTRLREGRPLDAPLKPRPPRYGPNAICSVEGCSQKPRIRGLCNFHYGRLRRNADLMAPRQKERTGRVITTGGYINILAKSTLGSDKSGYIREHRYAMQQMLGRPLLKQEQPHHINGVRSDNRPENLELWSTSHPAGQRVADKVAFAIEMLTLYPMFIGLDLVDQASLKVILARVKTIADGAKSKPRRRRHDR